MIFNSSQLEDPPVKPRLLAGIQEEKSHKLKNYSREKNYPVAQKIITGDKYPGKLRADINGLGLRERGNSRKLINWQKNSSGGYLVAAGGEFEPGSFGDRLLMEQNPHLLLEGIVLTAYALKIKKCYIYLRAGYDKAYRRLKKALREATSAGWVGKNIFDTTIDCQVELIRGGDAFICNNEAAVLKSIEARRPSPRADNKEQAKTIFERTAVVHNIETLALIPFIFNNNSSWFKKWGTEENPGFRLFCVSGAVNRPGVYEAPIDIDSKILIDQYCRGISSGGLKALFPGGIFLPYPTKDHTMTDLTAPEAGNIIVIPEGKCMVEISRLVANFYARQACGCCAAGREGLGRLAESFNRSRGEKKLFHPPEKLEELCRTVENNASCSRGKRAARLIIKIMEGWRKEFNHHYHHKSCDLK